MTILRGPWLCAATILFGCPDETVPRPHGDGDADADADGDGDADADADADAGEPDAAVEAWQCGLDADCALVIQTDACCVCPRAATAREREADPCLLPYPVEPATVPEECRRECAPQCPGDPCLEPGSARCSEGRCSPLFPGHCLTHADCTPPESCLEDFGVRECGIECELHTDCDPDQHCRFNREDRRDCEDLEPGQCVTDDQCPGGRCVGLTDRDPGTCQ
jgi:hypothetical protein